MKLSDAEVTPVTPSYAYGVLICECEYMYVEDKEYLYIGTLHTDFISNFVKLRNQIIFIFG